MRRFIAEDIIPHTRNADRRRALLDALQGKLQIDYDTQRTRTAAQTFAAREGNCLSLVIMAAAMAKQLGIDVTYQEVRDFDTWSRTAGFAILSQHVNLVLGPRVPIAWLRQREAAAMIVDFLPPRQVADAVSRPVAEHTVIAMYMNNRAVETMINGNVDQAYWLARAALEADPGFVNAANTLGVIYIQRNLLEAAEPAIRFALQRDPDNVSALTNLIGILNTNGHSAEAQALQKRLADIQRHPPFYFYDRGMEAMQAGQLDLAAKLFEKALAQRPYDVPSHFQLALVALRLGDMRRARKQLELAMKNSTTPETRALYAAKLQHLKSEKGVRFR
ncbi:MAG: tetratricopeptide repeat protein [Rudaea sp.]